MRAMTVRQPWAWAIVHGGKDVENRTRNVAGSYRGPVAIHAGLTPDLEAMGDPRIRSTALAIDREQPAVYRFHGTDYWHKPTLVLGAIIGVADLVDVHEARPELHAFDDVWAAACCSSLWAEYPGAEVRRLCDRESHWVSGGVHLVLANPRPLEVPIPARGMLGLWTPPPVVLEQLQAVTA